MKFTRPKLFCLGAAAALLAALPSFAARAAEKRNTDFTQILTADDTAGVFVVENFFKYAAFEENSPMARLLHHPGAKLWARTFLSDLPKVSSLEETLGLTSKDLPRLFSGKMALAVVMRGGPPEPKPSTEKDEDKADDGEKSDGGEDGDDDEKEDSAAGKLWENMQFAGVALTEYLGSPAEFEELATKLEAEVRRDDPKADIKRERVEGLLLRSIETDFGGREDGTRRTFHCALSDGTIIVSTSRAQVLDTVQGLSRGVVSNPLSGRGDYIAVKKEMGLNDGFLFVNLAALMPKARDLLAATLEDQTKSNPMMKAMIDPKTVTDALALENFGSLYGSLNVTEEKMEARYGLTWKERAGLARLFAFGQTPVSLPPYASADYKGVDVTTVDYPGMWEAIDQLLHTASPGAYAALGMGLASKPEIQDVLIKLRKGFLENLEPETVSLLGFPTAMPSDDEIPGNAYVFRVRDAAAAQTAIEAAASFNPLPGGVPRPKPEVRDYLGVKIYQFPAFGMPTPPAGNDADGEKDDDGKGGKKDDAPEPEKASDKMRVAYAIVENRLVMAIGADGLIEGVIANLQKPGRALADGKFKDELGDLPGIPCGIAYRDVSTFLMTLANQVLRTTAYRQAGIDRNDVIEARRAAKEIHYFWAGKSYVSPDGIYGRVVVTEDKRPGN